MEQERTKLIGLAADPAVPMNRVEEALTVIAGEKQERRPTGFLSEKQAREFVGFISRSTLWKWRKNGLRTYNVHGRVLFDPNDLITFIKG